MIFTKSSELRWERKQWKMRKEVKWERWVDNKSCTKVKCIYCGDGNYVRPLSVWLAAAAMLACIAEPNVAELSRTRPSAASQTHKCWNLHATWCCACWSSLLYSSSVLLLCLPDQLIDCWIPDWRWVSVRCRIGASLIRRVKGRFLFIKPVSFPRRA